MPTALPVRRATRLCAAVLATTLASVSPTTNAQTTSDPHRAAESMAKLQQLPPDQRHDCVAAGFAAMLLVGVYLPSTPPEQRLKTAAKLASLSKKMKVERIQKDYALMGEELQAHANDSPFTPPPKLEAALKDVAAWQKATCPDSTGR